MASVSFCAAKHLDNDIYSRRPKAEGERNAEICRQLPTVLLRPGVKEGSPWDALNV